MVNDKNNRHFDISAAVIRQLGEELVSDEVTAVMELIKNSYDADANWVRVEINTKDNYNNSNLYYKDSAPGYISIEDDGFGMSEDDIWNSWMKISLSSKKKFKADGLVTPKGRTPLGEKGVGRLSTQRIGTRLELFTGKKNSDQKNHVAFDWDQFDDDTSLTSVPVHIDSFKKSDSEKGTTLVVTNLKEPQRWLGSSWDRFRGQISQMIFPYKDKRVFNVYLKLNGQNVDLDEMTDRVINNSVGKFSFNVSDKKAYLKGEIKLQKLSGSNKKDEIIFYENNLLPDLGKDFFAFLTDEQANKKNFIPDIKYSGKKNILYTFAREIDISQLSGVSWIIDEDNKVTSLAYPGNFEGEINDFFFKESTSIENAFDSLSEFKRIVQNQVGVRIFRDGFGIKPYGIDGQDWLRLSGGQTSGGSFYGLRPGNIIGYIAISAKENKDLKEKTDREGFVDSPYSRNFMRIMAYFISEINDTLESTRRSYNDYRSLKGKEKGGITDVKDAFKKLTDTSSKAKNTSKKAKEIKLKLEAVTNKVKIVIDKQVIGKNAKEDKERDDLFNEIVSILSEAQNLLLQIEDTLEEAKKLDQHVEFLKPQIEGLEQQLSDFSELAGLGLTAEALSHELSNLVIRLVDETDRVNKKIKGKETIDTNLISIYIEYVKSTNRSFRKQLSHLAPSLKYVRENKDKISITQFINEITEYYTEKFGNEIEVKESLIGSDFFVKMNKGKLIQIVDNIIINSEYWLKEKKKREPKFKANITLEIREPFIRIYDNGEGIEPNLQDRIFQPFITAKPKSIGRGLGLFIVQQLLETNGCEITLLNEKNNYGRRYIFQLNMSSVVEI
ncbi:MAG: ATP-binding protein [Chitinophagales bacterium]